MRKCAKQELNSCCLDFAVSAPGERWLDSMYPVCVRPE